MRIDKKDFQEIKREASDIAKCAGLTCSRIALFLCLLILLYPMRPSSVYLLAITGIFPWVLGNILETKEVGRQKITLTFCAAKYLYTPARYLSEKCTGIGLILLLIAWQISVTRSTRLDSIWKIAPACCLLIYCLCRIISTIVFRRKIRHEYFHMELLD